MRILVVLVKTEQAPVPFTRDYVQQFFFGNLLTQNSLIPTNASVADYYRAASGGRLILEGEVLDWFTLTNSAAQWSNSHDPQFVEAVAEHASKSVRLGRFDNDSLTGVGGSSKSDGFVDFLAIIYASGTNEPAPGGYRFKYSMLNDTNNKEWRPPSPTADPTGIEDFIVLPWEDLGTDYSIGVVCHEIGHFLGLPDLYKRNDPYPTDIGHWCLMCWGCCRFGTAGQPFFGSSKFPPIFSAWCRDFLGWGQRSVLDRNGFAAIASARTGTYLEVAELGDPDERLLVEFYTPPTAASPWGRDLLPSTNSGFLVWHIDNRVGSGMSNQYFLWPSTSEGSGQNDFSFAPSIMSDTAGLATAIGRPLVRLIPADGRLDLENPSNMLADSDDLFITNKIEFKQASKGLTFYRSTTDMQLTFDCTNRRVTRSTGQITFLHGIVSAPSTGASPVAPARSNSSALLHEIADDPNLLNSSEVRSNFMAVPESEVCEFCVIRGDPIMFLKHQEFRTFSLNASNPLDDRLALAITKAKRFTERASVDATFVLGEHGTNVQRIEKLRIPAKGTNQIEDAKTRLSAVKSLWDLPSTSTEIVLDNKPTSTERPDATSEVRFQVFGKVGRINLPLAFVNGAITYSNGVLEGIEINRQVSVREMPTQAVPKISTNTAIQVTKQLLENEVPPGTSYTAEMELFPTGIAKDQWKIAFKVAVHVLGANPIFTYVDAQSGDLLPNDR